MSESAQRALLSTVRQIAAEPDAAHRLSGGNAVSAFNPKLPTIERPLADELLGRFVPAALRRPSPVAKPLGPFRLAFLGVLTAGWWPCRALQNRLDYVESMHARQFELAVETLAGSSSDAALEPIRRAVKKSMISMIVRRVGKLCLLAAIVLATIHLMREQWSYAAIIHFFLKKPSPSERWAIASIASLSVAYLLLIFQVNCSLFRMRRFAEAINGLPLSTNPIALPRFVSGFRPAHLLVGLVMTWIGWLWALPMMLAWGAFVSYATQTSYAFRVALADRVQATSGVAPIIDPIDLCPNEKCRNALPQDAEFCPRCGSELDGAR